jgi:hypothetical protein
MEAAGSSQTLVTILYSVTSQKSIMSIKILLVVVFLLNVHLLFFIFSDFCHDFHISIMLFFFQHNGIEIWARPITPVYQNFFSYAVAFLNRRTDGTPSDVAVTLKELGLFNPGGYSVEVRYF